MLNGYEVEEKRVDDVNAEHWEELANALPPSMSSEADLYRSIAKRYRESDAVQTVKIGRRTTG
jgi:hypothetical protein